MARYLREQLEDYAKSKFSAFIALICRVKDENARRELKRKYPKGEIKEGKKLQLIRISSEGKKEISPGKVRRPSGNEETGWTTKEPGDN